MKKILLMSICAAAFLLFFPADIYACSCLKTDASTEEAVKDELKTSGAVFSGKVIDVVKDNKTYFVRVKIRVDKIWKGDLGETVTISTGRGGGDCGIRFAVGDKFLVYAYKNDKNQGLSTSICTRTTRIANAEEDLKILGEGKTPKKKIIKRSINRNSRK